MTYEIQSVKDEAKRRIKNLVEDYMRIWESGKKEAYNEERVKIAFVVPLLEALGWYQSINKALPKQATLSERKKFVIGTSENRILVEVRSPNESLDGYEVTREGSKSYATQAIQNAWNIKAGKVILTNFEETRLYDSHVRKPEDGLLWKIRFTEYELRFDELWLVSKENMLSGALRGHGIKVERPPEDDQVTALLKREGPLTRQKILEKLGLGQSYEFLWYIRKFGSRKRKLYYLEGQEEMAREAYEDMLKPAPKPPSLVYPKEYFLNLLNLKRTTLSPASDGTPVWWERRANRQYVCSACNRSIENGERYIGRRKLTPGMRGIYGYRGTYVTDCFHITCLLRGAEAQIKGSIRNMQSEINGLENEVAGIRKEIPLKRAQIEACRTLTQEAREDYELASFWRKIDKWFSYHYTSWSKSREISRLEKETDHIENREIPERETRINSLKGIISNLESQLSEIETRMQELISHNVH